VKITIDTTQPKVRGILAVAIVAPLYAGMLANIVALKVDLQDTRQQLATQRRHTRNLLLANAGTITELTARKFGIVTVADNDADYDGFPDAETETED
jgi:hypothetical protein